MSTVAEITQATFDTDVLQSDLPVLVDFWAPWCGPCRLVAGAVDDIAQAYSDRAKVVKINVDDHAGVASQYSVRSIPTLIVFKGGQEVDRITGAAPTTTLAHTLDQHLTEPSAHG